MSQDKPIYIMRSLRILTDKRTGHSCGGKQFLSRKEHMHNLKYATFRYNLRVLMCKIFCKKYRVVLYTPYINPVPEGFNFIKETQNYDW